MKVRLVVDMENDQHRNPDEYSVEEYEELMKGVWQGVLNLITMTGGKDENANVIECKLLEE